MGIHRSVCPVVGGFVTALRRALILRGGGYGASRYAVQLIKSYRHANAQAVGFILFD